MHAVIGTVLAWMPKPARISLVALLGWTLSLALFACAGQTPAPDTAGIGSPLLPPLPSDPWAAMPSSADGYVRVDLARLRGTEIMGRVQSVLGGTCLDTPALQALLQGADTAVVAFQEGQDEFIAAVSGEPSVVTAQRLTQLGRELHLAFADGTPEAPARARFGRVETRVSYGLHIAELAPGLVLVGTAQAMAATAQGYDQERAPLSAPAELAPRPGAVEAYSSAGLVDDRTLARAPSEVATPLRGAAAAASVATEADGVHLHLRAALASPQQVEQLLATVERRLKSASLVLRLMGLPALDQRLIGQQEGQILDYQLHLTWAESGRLLKLGEMEAGNAVHKGCPAPGPAAVAEGDVP